MYKRQAVEQARQNDLNVILMDIQMPGMDGLHASELIRQLPNHEDTPIIAVTAQVMHGEREQFLQSGMDDYLSKPIDEKMLYSVLRRHVPEPEVTAADDAEETVSLDWALAQQQAANKPELARDLLKMLLDFLAQVRPQIEAQLDGQHQESLLEIIHKLHGSCSYSGVPRLKQHCAYLEQQLRRGVTAEALEPEWLELLDEMAHVEKAAGQYLSD